MKKSKSEEAQAGSAATQQVSPQVTPIDIQQKEFRLAFRGYNERDVDVFLDQLTEEVARLNSENKRLREQMQFRGTVSMDTSSLPEAEALIRRAEDERDAILRSAQEEAGRIVGEARSRVQASIASAPGSEGEGPSSLNTFIAREREFLQSLASLVQNHAEGVKANLRAARQAADPGASSEQPEPTSTEDRTKLWGSGETSSTRPETPATQVWAQPDDDVPFTSGAESVVGEPPGAEQPVGEPAPTSTNDPEQSGGTGRAEVLSEGGPPGPDVIWPEEHHAGESEREGRPQVQEGGVSHSPKKGPFVSSESSPSPPPSGPSLDTGTDVGATEIGSSGGTNPQTRYLSSPAAQPREAEWRGDEPEASSLRELFWGED